VPYVIAEDLNTSENETPKKWQLGNNIQKPNKTWDQFKWKTINFINKCLL
jgi:hypothetical protein